MKRKGTLSIILVIAIISTMCMSFFSVKAVAGSIGDTIYLRTTSSGTPNCYAWKGAGGAGNENKAWPGIAMTQVEENVYSYTLTDAYEQFVFNGSFPQTADLDYPGNGMIYDLSTNQWSPYAGANNPPVIVFSKKDGSSFRGETTTVKITAANADSASYTVNGGSSVSFKDSVEITVGEGVDYGSTVTISAKCSNQYGQSESSITLTKKEPSQGGGSTGSALGGYYGTNPDNGVGSRKTITVDGDKSDWEKSMLIAQGVANDDPRVYCHWSMHEIPVDDYAMYAAWDNDNLYIMYEMANVQDVVAPNDDFPLSQGSLWIYNLPFFLYIYTGNGNVTHGETANGTLWDTGITFDDSADHIVAASFNGANGPFVYTADDEGLLDPDKYVTKGTNIQLKWGSGKTLSGELHGVDGAGTDQGRVVGDSNDESSNWVDFYQKGHDSKYDMFYEMAIPLSYLDISASDIENKGIGIMKVSTFGQSGMNCLPYDLSMQDNAANPYSKDESSSMEKEDEDHITVPFARIGKMLSDTPIPSSSSKQTDPEFKDVNVNYNLTHVISSNTSTTANKTYQTTLTPEEGYKITSVTAKSGNVDLTVTNNNGTYTVSGDNIKEDITITAVAELDDKPIGKFGDADGDGSIDIRDAAEIQKASIGLSTVSLSVGDINKDGKLDIQDATHLQKYLAGLVELN